MFVLAVSVSLMLSSGNLFAKDIKGDGNLITKSIPVSKFSKIEIEASVEVNYSQAPHQGNLEFTVDQNLLDYYDISARAEVLHIKLKEEYKNDIRLKPTKSVITVSSETLKGIEIAGSTIFNFCTTFTSENLTIELAGSNKIFAKKFPVNMGSCSIETAGANELNLTGKIGKADLEISGAGTVNALDCKFGKLAVDISGSGTVEAYVTDKLDVEISGSGNVSYKGDPKVTSDIAGLGKVKKLKS